MLEAQLGESNRLALYKAWSFTPKTTQETFTLKQLSTHIVYRLYTVKSIGWEIAICVTLWLFSLEMIERKCKVKSKNSKFIQISLFRKPSHLLDALTNSCCNSKCLFRGRDCEPCAACPREVNTASVPPFYLEVSAEKECCKHSW